MPRGRELTDEERAAIDALHFEGKSSRSIAFASTRRSLFDHQLHVTDWPAKSPDLNPIENAWGYLVHHVYKDGKQYYSLNDLREAIIREAQDFIKKLIDSMPKRVTKVVEANGNAIGY